MNIWVYSVCHNDAPVLPYYLRHYSAFADRIIVYDDRSTDGSRDILRNHPLVTLRDYPFTTGLDENVLIRFAQATYKEARGLADWVMWPDCDELLHHPDWRQLFDLIGSRNGLRAMVRECDILQMAGFNMLGNGLPWMDDGRQLWDQMQMGVRGPIYNKPVVFRPGVDIEWCLGKHRVDKTNGRLSERALGKLLHYRYLGEAYTRSKNAKNYDRCANKKHAWSCSPGHTGEHSALWAEEVKQFAFNVMTAPLHE